MPYRVQAPVGPSDTDSESETYWKRLSSCAPKSDTQCQKRRKGEHGNIWVRTANENILNEALSNAHIGAYSISHDAGSSASESWWAQRHVRNAKARIKERRWNESVPRHHIGITFDSPPDAVKATLVRLLKEPNEELISQVVDALGCKRALEFYYLTEDIENIGGLYCADGTRRRSPGGVFLNLIKMSREITESEKKSMFALSRRMKDKLKRKRRRQRLESRKTCKEVLNRRDVCKFEEPGKHSNMTDDASESTKIAEEGEIMSTSESESFVQNGFM